MAVGAGLLVVGVSVPGSIGSGGRSLREVAHYSAEGLDFVTRHGRHGPESFVYLGWLTPLLAAAGLVLLLRARRFGLALALAVGAIVPIVLALGTHFPLYATLWHHFPPLRFPRVPERQMPVACLALAALAAVTVAAIAQSFPRRATLIYAVVIVALFADLRVSVYRLGRADPANGAYAALRSQPPGRLLELPMVHPSVHRGSVYLYYDMQARRERPAGYSTVAPTRAATIALALESLNCGDWLPGNEALLRRLGVRYVAFHDGLFSGGRNWFAWRALAARGWGTLARGGGITMLARGRPPTAPPVGEPRSRIVFCPQWKNRSPLYEHSALWARGPGRLTVRLATNRARPHDDQLRGCEPVGPRRLAGDAAPAIAQPRLAPRGRGHRSRRPRPADREDLREPLNGRAGKAGTASQRVTVGAALASDSPSLAARKGARWRPTIFDGGHQSASVSTADFAVPGSPRR